MLIPANAGLSPPEGIVELAEPPGGVRVPSGEPELGKLVSPPEGEPDEGAPAAGSAGNMSAGSLTML